MTIKNFCIVGLIFISSPIFAQSKRPKQGVCGEVLWKSGNLMPAPGTQNTSIKGTPVMRDIYIYELTNEKQVVAAEEVGFYQKINSKLIKKITSNKKGGFAVRLPAGYYSVFIKEEKGFYANLFDDAMNINPIHINKGKWLKAAYVIDYAAFY